MAEKKEPIKAETKRVDVNAFIKRKLKDINEMQDQAKAKDLAERVMSNKRGK